MKRVIIKNLSNVETHSAEFATQELADAWIAQQKAKGINCAWGRPAWTETPEEGAPINHPDQFTVEITDVTAQHQYAAAVKQLHDYAEFGRSLAAQFAIENVVMGIDVNESDSVLLKMDGVLAALSNGYLETAIKRAKAVSPSDYDAEFITAARLLSYVNAIETKLGISLSQSL